LVNEAFLVNGLLNFNFGF